MIIADANIYVDAEGNRAVYGTRECARLEYAAGDTVPALRAMQLGLIPAEPGTVSIAPADVPEDEAGPVDGGDAEPEDVREPQRNRGRR